MSVVRGSSLQGFTELVTELGGDPSKLLAGAKIPPNSVGDQGSFISDRSVIAVLEAAAKETATQDFGRRLAMRQGLEVLGPVGVVARTAPTVGGALLAVEQYMSVYSPALSAVVDSQPGHRFARFEWRLLVDRPPPHPQSAELGIGVAVRVFRLLAGADFHPASVEFTHWALTEVEDYRRYFGGPVRFGAERTGFLFPRSILQRPLHEDSAVHQVVRDYLNSIVVPTNERSIEPVRTLIRRMLPTGGLDLDLVASHLALHPRTLQRQLKARGTSFARLVEEVRREEAERYLRDASVPLSQLSRLLGYSEQSVLTRSCRRWFGMTPTAQRRDATGTE